MPFFTISVISILEGQTNVGDRGYISSKLFAELFEKGLQLITRLRKGMHNKLLCSLDQLMLCQRGVIESVNNKLKSCCQIEHHRHRSPQNFLVNLLAGLIAYMADPKKPKMRLSSEQEMSLQLLVAA